MAHRVGMAIVCLHISAVLYLLLGVLFAVVMMSVPEKPEFAMAFGIGLFVFCAALAVGIEFVVAGLKKRKFWAWVAGIAIFAMYLPSAFLPLGAFGMWGLLDGDRGGSLAWGPSRARCDGKPSSCDCRCRSAKPQAAASGDWE